MEKLRDSWQRFMRGRNGLDELGQAALIAGCILYIITGFLRSGLLRLVSLALIVYSLYRSFSRDRERRMEENRMAQRYAQLVKLNVTQRTTHRIYMCRRCGKLIRVPKGKGKIEIRCPVCGNKMIRRT